MEWEEEKVMKLIELYHSKPLLWDPKHRDYKLRPKRYDALDDIANELSTSVNEVERKIKNLTSHYYREKKKSDSSNKSGAGTDEIYQSKWFAYKSLHFLRNKNMPTRRRNITDDNTAGHNSQLDSDSQSSENYLSQLPKPNKRPRITQKDDIMSEALTIIMRDIFEQQNASKIPEKDEDGLFGDYIAGQLRKMEKSTKAIVRHRINNIIFEAESGSTVGST
ncbi:uncharacterized protein LOC121734767 [Aricia agestis]|uniref:uncharacterized protein LOC121734767 n=1 Tax=Aricia agestis TaxID=91739 RepID=UPI001C206F93|nr:uncharacterized protein LOC121734767 [Aricia agestis]